MKLSWISIPVAIVSALAVTLQATPSPTSAQAGGASIAFDAQTAGNQISGPLGTTDECAAVGPNQQFQSGVSPPAYLYKI